MRQVAAMTPRRGSASAVAVLLCLSLVAVADASSPPAGKLTGHIKPSGRAELRISYKRIDGRKYRSYDWSLDRIPLHCKSGHEISKPSVEGGMTIWNRYADDQPFGITEVGGSLRHPVYKATVHGHLVSRNKARGLVRVHGSSVPLRGGGHGRCESHRLHWKAHRSNGDLSSPWA
jgi:hypothetical protein